MSVTDRVQARLVADGVRGHDRERIVQLVREEAPLLAPADESHEVDAVLAALEGLGPLEAYLRGDGISDVLVNGDGRVWIERHGELAACDLVLRAEEVERLIERIVGPLGLRADRASPVVDARLPDGSRVHAIVPPLAVDGPCLTIRRFAAADVSLASFTVPAVAELLASAVRSGANIVVAGGTGSGKTTLLNALAREIPPAERVVTVEDAAELRLARHNVVRLESRPANPEGVGRVTVRDLVRSALRMRPDRIVVGECRGGEALDMLQAMNTGHEGSMTTCHANGCEDALRRLETMVLFAEAGLPLAAVREQLASAVDLIVQVARTTGTGRRRITAVAEVVPAGAAATAERVRLLVRGDGAVAAPIRHRLLGAAP